MPVLCGTSLRTKGVQLLLDAVVDYLPSPLDIPAVRGTNPDTDEEEERPPIINAPAAALVFKIQTDPYIGRLAYVRVYSGVLQTGQMLQNSNKDRKERIGRLVQVYAEKREEVTELRAGDIGAIVGVKQTFTGETLCDPAAPDRAGSHRVPRSGDLHGRRAEDQGRPGQAGQRPAAAGGGRSDLPRPGGRAEPARR